MSIVITGDAVVRSEQTNFEIVHIVTRESRKYRGADGAEDLPPYVPKKVGKRYRGSPFKLRRGYAVSWKPESESRVVQNQRRAPIVSASTSEYQDKPKTPEA